MQEDREHEATLISGLCPTRPVLPQEGQSLLRGARLNINQVAALTQRGTASALLLGVALLKEIPLEQLRATQLIVSHKRERNTTILPT